MPASFLHGIETIEVDKGARTIQTVKTAVIGLIGTAPVDTVNEEYKNVLRLEGLLTRDPRVKERKKYGRKRARKRFQFSKR